MKKALLFVVSILPVCVFAQDKAVPVPSAGSVTLPLDEYNHLMELASKPARKADTPPVPYILKCAELKLRAADQSVRGTIQWHGEILHKGETKIPLTTGMAILDVRQEGKNVPLELENGTHTAVLAGPAEFTLSVDTGLPLNIEAGRASFTFSVPSAGSVSLSFIVPGDRTNVHLNPGLVTSRTTANGQTAIEATLVPGQNTTVWWTTREIAAPTVPKEVRFLSDVKTLISVSEADVRIAALADISVVQGQPSEFQVSIPAGFELTGVSGASVESSDLQSGVLTIKVRGATQKSHQFLIALERSITETKAEAPFLSFNNAQREMGEVLIEGAGTIELTATEGGGLKRMDLKETNPYLRSLARFPAQSAFRYHKQPNEQPSLALAWTRFPDSSVLAAVAERAIVTTLVTNEGHSLTEVKLIVKNQAQPYLKVELPAGASILTAEVAGEKVKPVEGSDGHRVPLLRTGFRPAGSYAVSFVFMHSGAPFAKKGGSDISLPKMNIPVNLLQWEVFLPEQYKVKDFGGDAIAASLLPPVSQDVSGAENESDILGTEGGISVKDIEMVSLLPGQLGGIIVDPSGAAISNAQVTVTQLDNGAVRKVVTDSSGRWIVSNVPSGRVQVVTDKPGFSRLQRNFYYDGSRPMPVNSAMSVGTVAQTVTVEAEMGRNFTDRDLANFQREAKKAAEKQQLAASANVTNLQQRVSGVLPVGVEVPRAGNSYHFVRPLVLDEETKVTFTYRSK